MIQFSNEFQAAAFKERLAWKNLNKTYTIYNTETKIDIRPYEGMDPYDIAAHHNNKKQEIDIIELKIRYLEGTRLDMANKEGWFFEKNKYTSLKKIKEMDPDRIKIKYISFTNNGTYIWDIDQLEKENKLKIGISSMNKATMCSTTHKIDKHRYCLKSEWAQFYPYYWTEEQFHLELRRMEEEKNKTMELFKKNKKSPGFEI